MRKRLRLWWLRHRVKYLKEAVIYVEGGIANEKQHLLALKMELRRCSARLATETPASMMLEELNASRRI